MPKWKGRTRGNLLGFSIFIFTLRYLGQRASYLLLFFVTFYFFLFSNKKPTYYYFRKIHCNSFLKTVISIYRNYYCFGKVLLDKTIILLEPNNKFNFYYENEEYLRKLKDGGILISAHMGNWEIAGQLLNRIDTKFNIVAVDAEHSKIKEYLEKTYKNKNFNVIKIKDDFSHIFEIYRALKAKELICMHGDRFINEDVTVEMDFLGKKALFPKGPFLLAAKFNVPVSFVFAMKESYRLYYFTASEPVVYCTNTKNTEIQINKAMSDYISEVESMIKKYPLQWFNFYNFWKC